MTNSPQKLLLFLMCTAFCFTACKKEDNTDEDQLRKIKSMTITGNLQNERIEFNYDGENLSEVKRFISGKLQHIFR